MPAGKIVHLCQKEAWGKALEQGAYHPPSLDREGFIHCSHPDQFLGVANRFYRGVPDLVLLWIDPEQVKAEIRWETADGEEFPHIYGPLDIQAVTAAYEFTADEDGIFRSLPGP